MAIRSILVPVGERGTSHSAVTTAFQVAGRFGAHVEGFHVRPEPRDNPPPIAEGMSDVRIRDMMTVLETRIEEAERAARVHFDEGRERDGVDYADAPSSPGTASAAWRVATGREADLIAQRGRVFDLVVMSGAARWRATLEAALFDSGGPVLVAPGEAAERVGETVVIGWDKSAVCARAVAAALPFLQAARKVTVVHVRTGAKAGPSAEDVAGRLARHGVEAAVESPAPRQRRVGETLLSKAGEAGADLLVMGAYAHTRLRELILGGVTQHVLGHATCPVLMAH